MHAQMQYLERYVSSRIASLSTFCQPLYANIIKRSINIKKPCTFAAKQTTTCWYTWTLAWNQKYLFIHQENLFSANFVWGWVTANILLALVHEYAAKVYGPSVNSEWAQILTLQLMRLVHAYAYEQVYPTTHINSPGWAIIHIYACMHGTTVCLFVGCVLVASLLCFVCAMPRIRCYAQRA